MKGNNSWNSKTARKISWNSKIARKKTVGAIQEKKTCWRKQAVKTRNWIENPLNSEKFNGKNISQLKSTGKILWKESLQLKFGTNQWLFATYPKRISRKSLLLALLATCSNFWIKTPLFFLISTQKWRPRNRKFLDR